MCYNCGCHIPQDDMGHPDNITDDTFKKIADDKKMSVPEAKKYMQEYIEKELHDPYLNEVFEKASKAWGQSIPEAKKYTLELLLTQK